MEVTSVEFRVNNSKEILEVSTTSQLSKRYLQKYVFLNFLSLINSQID